MVDEDDPHLLGLPRRIRFNYAASISYIDKYPDILVLIGEEHAKHNNPLSAALCWYAAMLQITHPLVQCDAAIKTVEAYRKNRDMDQTNIDFAQEVLLERAENGNEEALRTLHKHFTFPSNQP